MDCCLKTQGVLQISSDKEDRRIFWVGKIRQVHVFFGWLELRRDFFKYLKQSEDSC